MAQQITEIKKLRGIYILSLESGQDIRLPVAVLREHPLKIGQSFAEEEYHEKTAQTAYKKATERAVWLLSRQDYSEQGLMKKLMDAAFSQPTCQKVCDSLKLGHYLDDARFAENFIRRKKNRSGSRKISMDLRYKGIERETAELALESLSFEEEVEAACRLAKKYLSAKSLEPQDAFRKCAAYLSRRGYSWETVKAAYRMAGQSEEENDDLSE